MHAHYNNNKHVSTFTPLCVCMRASMCPYTNIHIYVHTHICTCTCTSAFIYACTCTYTYIHAQYRYNTGMYLYVNTTFVCAHKHCQAKLVSVGEGVGDSEQIHRYEHSIHS